MSKKLMILEKIKPAQRRQRTKNVKRSIWIWSLQSHFGSVLFWVEPPLQMPQIQFIPNPRRRWIGRINSIQDYVPDGFSPTCSLIRKGGNEWLPGLKRTLQIQGRKKNCAEINEARNPRHENNKDVRDFFGGTPGHHSGMPHDLALFQGGLGEVGWIPHGKI